jgi:hypothetical protein
VKIGVSAKQEKFQQKAIATPKNMVVHVKRNHLHVHVYGRSHPFFPFGGEFTDQ